MNESNIERIMTDIRYLEQIKNPDYPNGCTRHSYSTQDKEARKYILEECSKLNLTVNVDGVGNIRARYTGDAKPDSKPILIGSHIDTVTSGGAYDGVVGVMCSLETIRVIKENNISIKNPIEIIIFAEEEGSNFAGTLLGSKALVGKLTTEDLKKIYNDEGRSAFDIITEAGFEPETIKDHIIRPGDIKAMIEMHIEQGDYLDSGKYDIGIVQTIAGQVTYKITVEGVSNHAGSTRMVQRHDPMVGASEVITQMHAAAYNYRGKTAVATVGKISCYPDTSNAIAASVDFYVDIRDVDEQGIQYLKDKLKEYLEKSCIKYGLSYNMKLMAESPIVRLDPDIVVLLHKCAIKAGIKSLKMNSGAVHDSVMLTDVTKVGMIFVPSVKGLSHCPEEFTKKQDIQKGCNLLIDAVINLTNS